MKKLVLLIFAIVLVSFMVSNVVAKNSNPNDNGGKYKILFKDDFEKYCVDSFPSAGGWELWFNGAGSEEQVIVDCVSFSPTKSLKLLGLNGWAALAAQKVTTNSPIIGFEVAVKVDEVNGNSRDNARVAFTTKLSNSISREYAWVVFEDSGVIMSGGKVLQSYLPDRWYVVRQELNRDLETYSVWIDGKLMCKNVPVITTSGEVSSYPSYGIEAFSVSQCYNNVKVHFDDVKVFSSIGSPHFVVPEVPFGSLATLLGMFCAASTFIFIKKKKQ